MHLNKKDLILIRDGIPTDMPFIYKTWIQSLYGAGSWFSDIDDKVYFKNYNLVLNRLLQRPDVKASIACDREDTNLILSYVIYEKEVFHYAYTRKDWQKIGLARDLIPEKLESFTHLTPAGRHLWQKYLSHLKFNPFLI